MQFLKHRSPSFFALSGTAFAVLLAAPGAGQGAVVSKYSFTVLDTLWASQNATVGESADPTWFQSKLVAEAQSPNLIYQRDANQLLGSSSRRPRGGPGGGSDSATYDVHHFYVMSLTGGEQEQLLRRELNLLLYLDKEEHYEADPTASLDVQQAQEAVLAYRRAYAQLESYYIHLTRYQAAITLQDKCSHLRKADNRRSIAEAAYVSGERALDYLCRGAGFNCAYSADRARFGALGALLPDITAGVGQDCSEKLACAAAPVSTRAGDFRTARQAIQNALAADLNDNSGDVAAAITAINNANTSLGGPNGVRSKITAVVPPTGDLLPLERNVNNAASNYLMVKNDELQVQPALHCMVGKTPSIDCPSTSPFVDLAAISALPRIAGPNPSITQVRNVEPQPTARTAQGQITDAYKNFLEELKRLPVVFPVPELNVCSSIVVPGSTAGPAQSIDQTATITGCLTALQGVLNGLARPTDLEQKTSVFAAELQKLSTAIKTEKAR